MTAYYSSIFHYPRFILIGLFYLLSSPLLNVLEHIIRGRFEFWMKFVLVYLLSLSLGGLVCLELWCLFR